MAGPSGTDRLDHPFIDVLHRFRKELSQHDRLCVQGHLLGVLGRDKSYPKNMALLFGLAAGEGH